MKRALIAALGLSLVTLAPAPAYADWSAPELFTPTSWFVDPEFQQLESNAAGDMIHVVVSSDRLQIAVRRMPRGTSTWTNPKYFDGGTTLGYPSVALDEQGRACLAWSGIDGGPQLIYATCYRPGSGWGSPKVISKPTVLAARPEVAMVDGVGTFFWGVGDFEENPSLRTRRWNNGSWGAITNPKQPGFVSVAEADGSGRVTVATSWVDGVVVRTISPSGSWGAPVRLCRATVECGAFEVGLAVNRDGTALATWFRLDDPSSISVVASHRSGHGKWSRKKVVMTVETESVQMSVSSNGTDDVFAVGGMWTSMGSAYLSSAHRLANGSWTDATLVDSAAIGGGGRFVDSAMDADNVVTYIWRLQGYDDVEYGRVRPNQTIEDSGILSDAARVGSQGDELAVVVRGRRALYAVYADAPPDVFTYEPSWVKFTP